MAEANLKSFDVETDPSTLGQRWNRWFRSFEIYIMAKNITGNDRKKALLLHHAGEQVQDIWFTLNESSQEPAEGDNIYNVCKDALMNYFSPKGNHTFQRHILRSMGQNEGESISHYIARLRTQSVNCGLEQYNDTLVIDQLIEKCLSTDLRKELLKEGDNLTLDRAIGLATSWEAAERQAKKIEVGSSLVQNCTGDSTDVAAIYTKNRDQEKLRCFRCGSYKHFARDKECRARGVECRKCHKKGHYAEFCKSGGQSGNKSKSSEYREDKAEIRNIEENSEDDQAYVVTPYFALAVENRNLKNLMVSTKISKIGG